MTGGERRGQPATPAKPGRFVAASPAPVLAALLAALPAALPAASCAPQKSGATRAATRDEQGLARPGAATGLELLRWYVPNDPVRRRAGIDRVVAEGLATRVACELDSNGFTLLRADAARLGAALGMLGESASARSTLLGQPNAWTDLVTAQVAPDTVLFVAGRPRKADDSVMSLAIRGWCFPTVDAALARVELRLSQDAARVTKVTVDPSEVRVRSADLPSGRATVELGPEDALILLETPMLPPESGDGDGPATALPQTLASVLLDGRPFPNRSTVLVVLPALADILPPAMAAPVSVPTPDLAEPMPAEPPAPPSAPTGQSDHAT